MRRSSRWASRSITSPARSGATTPSASPSAWPRIAVSGVFSSWLTERRKARSASCARWSSSESSLKAAESWRSSVEPSIGSSSGLSPSASRRLASATRVTGRATARASRNATIGREDGADQRGESEPDEERLPVVRLVAGRAEEHDRVAAAEAGGVHERLAAHVDGAVRLPGAAAARRLPCREQQLRLRRRQDRQRLLLGGEEAAERGLAGRERVRRMLGDDQLDLAVEGAPGVVVERAARECCSDREHHDRRHGERRRDPDEETGTKRARAVEPAHTAAL